jgi:Xaa-Pro aminopeptidase
MRVVKDKEETRILKHASDLTAEAFRRFSMRFAELKSEIHAARVLESEFCALGGTEPAFRSIVAAGKNATVLHHSPTFAPLWKQGLVLVDAGSSFSGYSSDMTRTLPVAGVFSSAHAEAYDAVLEAFTSACKRAKPGNSLDDIHRAALLSICKGLSILGILKGKTTKLVRTKSYIPYYMHRTGHWLGIDVHDIAPIYYDGKRLDPYRRPLEAGNFITIEPGLYFDPKDKNVPAELRGVGIRIEDTVRITSAGHELLTDRMPKERKAIEELIGSSQKKRK